MSHKCFSLRSVERQLQKPKNRHHQQIARIGAEKVEAHGLLE